MRRAVLLGLAASAALALPLAACGGNESGTWDVGGGCIDVVSPMQLMSCPGARVDRATGRLDAAVEGAAKPAGGVARQVSITAEIAARPATPVAIRFAVFSR